LFKKNQKNTAQHRIGQAKQGFFEHQKKGQPKIVQKKEGSYEPRKDRTKNL